MENVSVSTGVFVHKGSYKIGKRKGNFQPYDYLNEPWYLAYEEAWSTVHRQVESIRYAIIEQIVSDLQTFVCNAKNNAIEIFNDEIPTAILLTGVNIPDHVTLFQKIVSNLSSLTPHIVTLWSKDSSNIKNVIPNMVYQLINDFQEDDAIEVKKTKCTMRYLKLWYKTRCNSCDPLIIVISDFESFPSSVLYDFILILSSYASAIKFVLIFGVATTLHVVHRTLPYDATSKLIVKVFHMQTQISCLSDVLEATIFSSDVAFRLTGRAFQFLTDVFLFYDFSVNRFLQNYKLCMIHHFYGNNVNSLCCQRRDIKKRIAALSQDDIEYIKKLPTVAKYLDNLKSNRREESFEEILENLLVRFHEQMSRFLTALKCLHSLVSTLPNAPLGKQLREVYTRAVYATALTESQEYKECLKLLHFLSKEELLAKLESISVILSATKDSFMKEFREKLREHAKKIEEASLEVVSAPSEVVSAEEKLTRSQLKEKLLRMSQTQSRSPFKREQQELIDYLERDLFRAHLTNLAEIPANEIFCYSDGIAVKRNICGSVKAAIHTGLNDPHIYLQCDCCKLENESNIPVTLPDLSIIYKLHLESRKLINMYDWLQAFSTIVDPRENSTDEKHEVDPNVQARFTRAVAELQFLGFIKTSKRKTDHVKKLD